MSSTLKTYGTLFTLALFMVTAITGVTMFFHVAPAGFAFVHEWLALLLLVPVTLHLWKNWLPMKMYFRRKVVWVPLCLTLGLATVMTLPSVMAENASNPLTVTLTALQDSTVSEVAAIYDLAPEELAARLTAKGFTVTDTEQSLLEIAQASGKEGGRAMISAVALP
ncbi:DUF4405 domain-containing protein [Pseudovibrio sp. SPO723]|uniref:DUF4405 domain-containing protein n=1 Tax=Nesiotobacter zosterae TaxID=392721 RepID=UPI0029C2D05C|nr:DUF4405 domain-containing protein [Pseudovibrio sp. SPO723]MDX5593748.1 DUF4405 domain-containing protein [Pseudovibrio sp. SPO723]